MSIGGFHDKDFCYDCCQKDKKIETLRATIKSKEECIKLLKQCDDSSTIVIGKMDDEIRKLQSKLARRK